MNLRIKEVAKGYGYDQKTLAKKLGISRQALNARLTGNPSMKIIQEIADVLNCSVFELIVADKDIAHFYDVGGEWLGIRRK